MTAITSQTVEPRVRGAIPGRALYVGKQGELYISRKYSIYRSEDWGASWQLDCFVPSPVWESAVARARLGARLLRHYVAAFQILADGSRIAVARDGLYRAEGGETRMRRVFRVTRGSRPLNFAADGPRVLFGEYGDNFHSTEVLIYVSQDYGRTFEVGFHFPKGDIRHVHNILVDPDRDGYWVLAGDFGREPGIGLLSKDLQSLEWLNRGNQRLRIVSALVEPDSLVCGTDSDFERNFIVRIDKKDGRIDDLVELEGSSLYAARFGPVRVISTCVEPNPACPSRECSLYASHNGVDWKRFAVHERDGYHPFFFQFGTIVLPYACNSEPRGIFSGQAISGLDDKVSFVDFSLREASPRASDEERKPP